MATRSIKSVQVEDPRIVAARAAFKKKQAAGAGAAKKTAKAQAAAQVADEVVGPAEEKSDIKSVWQKLISAFDELHEHPDFKAPSWQRTLCGLIAAGLVGAGIGYIGGAILNILVLGTLMLTTSTFLATLVLILGYVLIGVAAWIAGGKVATFICTGGVDKMYASAKSKVTGFFDRLGGESEVQHA